MEATSWLCDRGEAKEFAYTLLYSYALKTTSHGRKQGPTHKKKTRSRSLYTPARYDTICARPGNDQIPWTARLHLDLRKPAHFCSWFPNSRHCGLLEPKHYLQLPYSHKTWYMVTYAYTPNKEGQHLPYPMSTSSAFHIYWKGNRPPSSELQPCLPGFLVSKELKWQLKERLKPW